MNELLSVSGLKTFFPLRDRTVKAVNDVNFTVADDETLGIVGESGSGKSMTALSIMRLLPYPGITAGGRVVFKNEDLLRKSEEEMRRIRGTEISMIFQDPMSSLNPVLNVGCQIAEAVEAHQRVSKSEAKRETVRMMEKVGIPQAQDRFDSYPHHFSGGMRQRIMIAMALACKPSLLIADEPTTSLDVTIQAQVLRLMNDLQSEAHMSIVLITHNLGIIARMADKILVMYAGQPVEYADVRELFYQPLHPYTQGLIRCVPNPTIQGRQLYSIPGLVPDLSRIPPGCPFHPRCPHKMERCASERPSLFKVDKNRVVRCHLFTG